MKNPPLASALVLNFRSPKDTVRCVRALRKQTVADQLEIFVIDNDSDDESIGFIRAQLQNEPNVRIIEERRNLGYGRGNNHAASLASGEYLLIINPDNTMPEDGLEQMIGHLKNNPDTGIAGPALVYPDGSVRPSPRPFPSPLDIIKKRLFPRHWQEQYDAHMDMLRGTKPAKVDWLVGACLVMETALFRRLEGFDERFFLFFEDIDLCRRTSLLGKNVMYLPSVRVQDREKRLSGNDALSLFTRKTTRIHLASAVKYFWKWSVFGSRLSS